MIAILLAALLAALLDDVGDLPAAALRQALRATVPASRTLGYTPEDLAGHRFAFRLPAFDEWMQDAHAFDRGARGVRERLRTAPDLARLVEESWTLGDCSIAAPTRDVRPANRSLQDQVASWWTEAGSQPSGATIEEAVARLSPEAARALARFVGSARDCLGSWPDAVDPDRLDAAVVERLTGRIWELALDDELLDSVADGFDRPRVGRVTVRFCAAVEQLTDRLLVLEDPICDGTVVIPTPGGAIHLGGPGDTVHESRDRLLTVDVSGNDRYEPGTAAGHTGQPFVAVIDLDGDDVHASSATLAGAGAGELGVGVLIDVAGEDHYQVPHRGAGYAVLGAGVLHDRGGNDRYEGITSCVAVSLAGLGLVVDDDGDDVYETFGSGQGLGRPLGAGVLLDRRGDDRYVARDDPIIAASPQTAAHNLSMAQGAGYGVRHDDATRSASGGVGVLLDADGNDEYRAGVFGQAAGYWYGVGMLFDEAGDDTYHAAFYGQSAATHFALSYLLDRRGDDTYQTLLSSAMGDARDCSLAILRDAHGDDTYRAPINALGCGDITATGLFLDQAGDDAYTHQPGRNAGTVLFESGFSDWRRALPTVGIFLDLGRGRDSYDADVQRNGTRWQAEGPRDGMRGFSLDDG